MHFHSSKSYKKIFHTTSDKIFGDTVTFWKGFRSPQIKRNLVIITRKTLRELANDLKLRMLGNFKKILEMAGIKDKCPAGHLKSKL